jgi:hypothetical protein
MTNTTARGAGAGPEEHAHHAGGNGPALAPRRRVVGQA